MNPTFIFLFDLHNRVTHNIDRSNNFRKSYNRFSRQQKGEVDMTLNYTGQTGHRSRSAGHE